MDVLIPDTLKGLPYVAYVVVFVFQVASIYFLVDMVQRIEDIQQLEEDVAFSFGVAGIILPLVILGYVTTGEFVVKYFMVVIGGGFCAVVLGGSIVILFIGFSTFIDMFKRAYLTN